MLKPATVAFSDDAAMFQLQIVSSPDCAKAGPDASGKRKRGAAQVWYALNSSLFICSYCERT